MVVEICSQLFSSGSGEESDQSSSEEYSRSSSPSICGSVEEWKGLLDLPELDSLPRVIKDYEAVVLTSGDSWPLLPFWHLSRSSMGSFALNELWLMPRFTIPNAWHTSRGDGIFTAFFTLLYSPGR
jgi:hypothetical protein